MEQPTNKSKYSKIGTGPFKCSSCFEEKDKKEFSRKQILKEDRNCRNCVDKISKQRGNEGFDKKENKLLNTNLSENSNTLKKNLLCYNCKKYGHKKSECIKKGGGAFNPGGCGRKI